MRSSRVIPVVLILIIIAVAIAALVSLARAVFFSNGTSQTVSQGDVSRDALLNTSLSHSVSMTVRGQIVGDEQFRSYQIVVTPASRTLTTYSGYLETKIDQIALTNNTPAYEQFVFALNRANMIRGTELTGENNDLRGICASGRVSQFAVLQDNKSVKTLWTSTCSNAKGSLSASVSDLTRLFVNQIPGAPTAIAKIAL